MPNSTAGGYTAAPFVRLFYYEKGGAAVAYRALYRKWRPARFEDVVGQQAIVTALQNQLRAGRVGHAYLFTGTRGTGKTTCAKIFAKAVNCLSPQNGDPCGRCDICRGLDDGSILDVVEIDAASNNGVDSIRDLRDETAYTPSMCRYKVYIIDEVHMLSTPAFNALLKIMEEPPAHIIFILATTEIQKVPATIRSRCQRYDFGRIRPEDIAGRLEQVAGEENIPLTPEASQLIARLADGALRDALSILDTCASAGGEVDEQTVQRMAGVTDQSYLFHISDALQSQRTVEALAQVAELRQRSVDLRRLCEELLVHYRNLLLAALPQGASLLGGVPPQQEQEYIRRAGAVSQTQCVRAIQLLGEAMEQMSRGADQRIELELALFRLCQPEPAVQAAAVPVRQPAQPAFQPPPAPPAPGIQPPPAAQPAQTAESPKEARPVSPAKEPAAAPGEAKPFEPWQQVVDSLQSVDPLLYANLKGSRAFCDGRRVLIDGTEMFLEYIRQNDYSKKRLKRCIEQVAGVRYGVGPYHTPTQQQTVTAEDTLRQLEQLGVPVLVQESKHKGEDEQ